MLTIGFARRVPSYKRLTLMLSDPVRLRGLLLDPDKPVQIVIAGKAHPADEGGKKLIQQIVKFADQENVRHRIVFLPDYDMALGQLMVQGCDVWMNNPLRPLEACGTSGMKAALNGGLNLSIRDGWWDEWYDGTNGWAVPTADGVADPDRRDELEASALYDLIDHEVADRFYDRPGEGLPRRWLEMVRHTLSSLGPKVLAGRMLRDYVVELYLPAAKSARALSGGGHEQAKGFASWKLRVGRAWPGCGSSTSRRPGWATRPKWGPRWSCGPPSPSASWRPATSRCRPPTAGSGSTTSWSTLLRAPVRRVPGRRRPGRVRRDPPAAAHRRLRVHRPRRPVAPADGLPAELGLIAVPEEPAGMTNGTLR
nr:hypothetical protein GCM10020093_057230 [Planobispora longispora]